MTEKINLIQKWDKVFPQSTKVNHRKVTFPNRFGIILAADLYEPVNQSGKLPAIAVSGPFGAIKEQSSGLYAQIMAKQGFLTISFDPSFTGRVAGFLAMLHQGILIRRISKQQLTSYPYKKMLTQKKLVSLVSVVGVVWHSMQHQLIPE